MGLKTLEPKNRGNEFQRPFRTPYILGPSFQPPRGWLISFRPSGGCYELSWKGLVAFGLLQKNGVLLFPRDMLRHFV